MKKYSNPRKTFLFVLIAAVLMVFSDLLLMGGYKSLQPKSVTETGISYARLEPQASAVVPDFGAAWNVLDDPQNSGALDAGLSFENLPQPDPRTNAARVSFPVSEPEPGQTKPLKPESKESPPVRRFKNAKIAIVIDDMGLDKKRSYQAISLPPPMTLSFLPYASGLPRITQAAKAQGHELLVHVPMEPMDSRLNPGPGALRHDMAKDAFDAALVKALNSFEGYAGINNHMGSRLTQDWKSMNWVMKALQERDLFFVDSKTIEESIAEDAAALHNLPHAARDVFLDHVDTPEFVALSLARLEAAAYRRGYAIAIGHPKDNTIAALREWIPTLKDKGLTLVPVSALLRGPADPSLAASYDLPAHAPRTKEGLY